MQSIFKGSFFLIEADSLTQQLTSLDSTSTSTSTCQLWFLFCFMLRNLERMDLQLHLETLHVSGKCMFSIEAPARTPILKLSAKGKYHTSFAVPMDPIDILSSESEDEIEVGVESEKSLPTGSSASASSRKLPQWASTSSSFSKGQSVPSRNPPLPGSAFINRNGELKTLASSSYRPESAFGNCNGEFKELPSPSYRQTLNQHAALTLTNEQKKSRDGDNVARPANDLGMGYHDRSMGFNYTDISGKDATKLSSQQPSKRSLPPSLQPSTSSLTGKASMENGSGDLISDTGSRSYDSVGATIPDSKNYMKDKLQRESDDEVIMFDNRGSRILPPSLAHGKFVHNSHSAGLSLPSYHSGVEHGRHLPPSFASGKSVHNSQSAAFSDPSYRSGLEHSRLLPPSLMHGKSLHSSQSAMLSDPTHSSGVEERAPENDERLIFQAALQNLSQPKSEATLPDGLLTVSLMKHQKIALAWMFQKETASTHCLGGILADDQGLGKTISTIALILMQKHLQSRSASDDLQSVKTEALNLDDDDDDDGVVLLDKVKQIPEFNDSERIPDVSSQHASRKGRPAAGTLVVCPASVLRQWARELNEKVAESARLSVLIYHGGTRTKDPVELAKYDVVLTTYAIVANEVPKQQQADDDDEDQEEKYGLSSEFSINKKRKKKSNANKKGKKGRKGVDGSSIDSSGALAKVGWLRVILDEAQTIKNHRTQVARACSGLRAKRRWCLSGTPIQNTIDDLYSYFRFLKYDPYAVYQCFASSIKYLISRNPVNGYKKLQAVLKTIMLRRTKETMLDGKPIISLPSKSICLTKVDFSIEERSFYTKLEEDSRSQFKAYAEAGTVNQNYANILLLLLRLRQACDHPSLVKEYNSHSVGKASLEMARRLPRDMLTNLLNLLEDSMAICGVCSDPPEDAVVTMCGHVFCYQCVSEHLTGDDNWCPAHECKEQLGLDVVFSKATIRGCLCDELHSDATSSSEVADKSLVMQNMYCSSKIRAALEILEKHCKPKNSTTLKLEYEASNGVCDSSVVIQSDCEYSSSTAAAHRNEQDRPGKAIVFSQWTGMLDLVETSLIHACIPYRRFDGTMTLSSRDKAVKEFNTDPEVSVMLMSLKAGNLGLNMIAACHVILLDLWWNPTTEDQAIDRAHRIGQTRPVTVSRITIKDTVEDRILALQEDKRKMVASAFGEDQKGGSATRLTVEDLRYLFMV